MQKLLGIVPIVDANGGDVYFNFGRFNYINVNQTNLSECDIEIQNENGELFPITYGQVIVSLILRRIK